MSKKKPRGGAKGSAKAEGEKAAALEHASAQEAARASKPERTQKPVISQKLACATCGKAMKDHRTLKLHERNCKPARQSVEPDRPKPDPMLIALMDLKDAMAAERTEMLKMVAERDAAMGAQVAAIKAQATQERASQAAAERVSARTMPQPMGPESGYYERQNAWQEGPRWYPQQGPAPSVQTGPSQDDIRAMVKAELKEALASLEEPPKGLGEDEVAAIAKREVEAAAGSRKPAASPSDLEAVARSVESKLSALETRLGELEKKGIQANGEKMDAARVHRFNKDIERLDWKVEQLMDEVGFGDSLDVSKIPSNILEIVYQATLDDVVKEMGKTRSQQEVGTVIEAQLEEVRKNTSGSELFRYNGRRILAENLARSIDHGLISAKQIQTTYAELLGQLLESVPAYKPKNFRAMIKIKSQEYAVDRVTHLLGRTENSDKVIDNMGAMIAAFSAQSNARFNQMSARIDEVAGPMLERKVDASVFEETRLALNELRLSIAELARENSRLLAKLELGAAAQSAETVQAGEAAPSEDGAAGASEAAPDVPLTEAEKLVVGLLSEGAMSVSALRKRAEAFISPDDIKAALEGLREKGFTQAKKGKKGTRLELAKRPVAGAASEPAQPDAAQPKDAAPPEGDAAVAVIYAPEADQSVKPEGIPVATDGDSHGPAESGPVPRAEGESAPAKVEGGAGEMPSEPEVQVVEKTPEPVVLTDVQKRVLEAIGGGATMPSLRKAMEDVKYTEILVSVRVLIDAGLVSAESHGRGTTYSRVKGAKIEEVKKDA